MFLCLIDYIEMFVLVGRGGVVLHKTLMLVITKKVFSDNKTQLKTRGIILHGIMLLFRLEHCQNLFYLTESYWHCICPLVYALQLSFTVILYFMYLVQRSWSWLPKNYYFLKKIDSFVISLCCKKDFHGSWLMHYKEAAV